MEMSKRLAALLVAVVAILPVLRAAMPELQFDEEKNLYGYVNDNGKYIIKPVYEQALPFDGDRAKVKKNGKWGYINQKGKAVINLDYQTIGEFDGAGLAKVQKDDKWGYIDTNGKVMIPIQHEVFDSFDENGIARVKKNKKWGYIRRDGSYYIKPEYDFIGTPNEQGWLWVAKGKTLDQSLKGLYKGNKLVIKPSAMTKRLGFFQKTDSIDYGSGYPVRNIDGEPINDEIKHNFSKLSLSDVPYIWGRTINYKTFIWDLNGKLLLKSISGAVGAPCDEMVITRVYNSKKDTYAYNYWNTGTGKKMFKKDIVVPCDDEKTRGKCGPFLNGRAVIVEKDKAYVISRVGGMVSAIYNSLLPVDDRYLIAKKDNLYGILSRTGELVVPMDYTDITRETLDLVFPARKQGSTLYGCIDVEGNTVVPFNYEYISRYIDGRFIFVKDNKFGVADKAGNVLVEPVWEGSLKVLHQCNHTLWVQAVKDGPYQGISLATGEQVFPEKYDNAFNFDENNLSLVCQAGLWGLVNENGEVLVPLMMGSKALAAKARDMLNADPTKDRMTRTDAYRFNLNNAPNRHKYRLLEKIDDNMWDY